MENHIHYFSDPPNKTLEIRYKRTKKVVDNLEKFYNSREEAINFLKD